MTEGTTIEAPSTRYVDILMEKASRLGVAGSWRGGSYCYHPCGVIRRGLMIVGEHHVSNSTNAYVATEPDTDWTPALHHSTARGDPKPRPKSGELVPIYSSGRWLKEGPWQQVMLDVLDEIEHEVARAEEERARAEEADRMKRRAEQEQRDEELRQRWESSQ